MAGRTSRETTQDQVSLRYERNICIKHEILRSSTSSPFEFTLQFIKYVECKLFWHSWKYKIATVYINAAKQISTLRNQNLFNSKIMEGKNKVKLCLFLINQAACYEDVLGVDV
jgi:hypothetical protein